MKQILDIFAKSTSVIRGVGGRGTSVPEKKQKIIADYREKNSLVPTELKTMGFEIEFRELKIGDFIAKDVVIERKTVSDFISSMMNKRLAKQIEELKTYKKNLLIIEGLNEQELYSDDDIEERKGIHPNAVRGFLLSILIHHKIPIVFTKDYSDTAKFISVIMRKKAKEASLNVSKKSLNSKERLQFILEGFPGIGPKTAQKLLKDFKTLKEIINTPIEKLTESIGKKAEIFKLLDENY